ncbi:MAG TPA: FAD-dependent monooxygenase [Blastocatellia bacterium]|nr:FAD-dependent monooxygenase [Blastocatellia bacterium]
MKYDVIVVGGGPGGSSAAICLAEQGLRVLVLEEKRMPREKLCGEFITSECLPTLSRLGVMDGVLAAGAERITRLALNVSSGPPVSARLDEISKSAGWALSLSRARFDQILFDRARDAGAECLERVAVRECSYDGATPDGVEAISLPAGRSLKFNAHFIVDASGRNSRLTVNRTERVAGSRGSRLYAMKAHLSGVEGIEDQVELHFFRQGYGGLSRVENGLVNLCFIAGERVVKEAGGAPLEVLRRTMMTSPLAGERLARAEVVGKWLTAGPLSFGKRRLSQSGVIAVGDASGMIDPFTGTGIQIALRTGELAADAIVRHIANRGADGLVQRVLASYAADYQAEFGNRIAVAGILRRVALTPGVANVAARILALVPAFAVHLLRATRAGG